MLGGINILPVFFGVGESCQPITATDTSFFVFFLSPLDRLALLHFRLIPHPKFKKKMKKKSERAGLRFNNRARRLYNMHMCHTRADSMPWGCRVGLEQTDWNESFNERKELNWWSSKKLAAPLLLLVLFTITFARLRPIFMAVRGEKGQHQTILACFFFCCALCRGALFFASFFSFEIARSMQSTTPSWRRKVTVTSSPHYIIITRSTLLQMYSNGNFGPLLHSLFALCSRCRFENAS